MNVIFPRIQSNVPFMKSCLSKFNTRTFSQQVQHQTFQEYFMQYSSVPGHA